MNLLKKAPTVIPRHLDAVVEDRITYALDVIIVELLPVLVVDDFFQSHARLVLDGESVLVDQDGHVMLLRVGLPAVDKEIIQAPADLDQVSN